MWEMLGIGGDRGIGENRGRWQGGGKGEIRGK
jgi:hypothetical protein